MKQPFLCLLFLVAITVAPSFAQVGATLNGTLTHDVSATPIKAANISILKGDQTLGDQTTTDDLGLFSLKLPATAKSGDDIEIIIYHPLEYGFHRHIYRMNGTRTQSTDIKISRNAKLGVVGIVKDDKTKKFVEGLIVKVSSNKLSGPEIQPVKTNSFGSFSFVIPKVAFTGSTDYMDLLFHDPQGRYRDYVKTVNILTPVEILLDNSLRPSQPKRTTANVSSRTVVTIDVEQGSLVKITASGSIIIGIASGNSGPEGISSGPFGLSMTHYNLVPEFKHAVLMYALPGDTKWRSCGLGTQFIAQTTGKMEIIFEVNDNTKSDNSGMYNIEITVE